MPTVKVYITQPTRRGGFFSVWDVAALHGPRVTSVPRRTAFSDLINISGDWRRVGGDLRRAAKSYEAGRRAQPARTSQPSLFPAPSPKPRRESVKAG